MATDSPPTAVTPRHPSQPGSRRSRLWVSLFWMTRIRGSRNTKVCVCCSLHASQRVASPSLQAERLSEEGSPPAVLSLCSYLFGPMCVVPVVPAACCADVRFSPLGTPRGGAGLAAALLHFPTLCPLSVGLLILLQVAFPPRLQPNTCQGFWGPPCGPPYARPILGPPFCAPSAEIPSWDRVSLYPLFPSVVKKEHHPSSPGWTRITDSALLPPAPDRPGLGAAQRTQHLHVLEGLGRTGQSPKASRVPPACNCLEVTNDTTETKSMLPGP